MNLIINRVEGIPQHLNISFNETTELCRCIKDRSYRRGYYDIIHRYTWNHIVPFAEGNDTACRTSEYKLPEGLGEFSTVKEAMEQLDWISYSSDLPFIRKFWIEAFGECPPLLPRIIIPDIRIIKSMLVKGKGVSVMTDDMIHAELSDGSLKELWVPTIPITNEVWLAYRTIDQINPTLMKFVERCTSTSTPIAH